MNSRVSSEEPLDQDIVLGQREMSPAEEVLPTRPPPFDHLKRRPMPRSKATYKVHFDPTIHNTTARKVARHQALGLGPFPPWSSRLIEKNPQLYEEQKAALRAWDEGTLEEARDPRIVGPGMENWPHEVVDIEVATAELERRKAEAAEERRARRLAKVGKPVAATAASVRSRRRHGDVEPEDAETEKAAAAGDDVFMSDYENEDTMIEKAAWGDDVFVSDYEEEDATIEKAALGDDVFVSDYDRETPPLKKKLKIKMASNTSGFARSKPMLNNMPKSPKTRVTFSRPRQNQGIAQNSESMIDKSPAGKNIRDAADGDFNVPSGYKLKIKNVAEKPLVFKQLQTNQPTGPKRVKHAAHSSRPSRNQGSVKASVSMKERTATGEATDGSDSEESMPLSKRLKTWKESTAVEEKTDSARPTSLGRRRSGRKRGFADLTGDEDSERIE